MRPRRCTAAGSLALLAWLVSSSQAAASVPTYTAEDGRINVNSSVIESCGFAARRNTIPGWAVWGPATAVELTALQASNDTYYQTADPGGGQNSAEIFEFAVIEDPNATLQIDVSVEAAQERTQRSLSICLWDYSSGQYFLLGSLTGDTDQVFSTQVISTGGKFVNPADGQMTLFVVNADSNRWFRVDTLSVQVTPQPVGSAQFIDGEISVSNGVITTGTFGARRDTISGWANWGPATQTELTDLQASNDLYYQTADPGGGDNAAMLFEFIFPDDPNAIGSIDISVEAGRSVASGELYFYLWNYVTGTYDVLGSQPGSADQVFTILVATNPTQYINPADGQLTLFLVSSDRNETIRVDTLSVALVVIGGPETFLMIHDGAGVKCLAELINITAKDENGLTVTGYSGGVTLDTQTGTGSWSSVAGNAGFFVDAIPNDGLASYVFSSADNGVASFAITYSEGPLSVDLEVFQTTAPSVRDDDTEGLMEFAPSGFTVTATPLPNPPPDPIIDPIPRQTAGAPFPLHIAAFGITPTDAVCGVIEGYEGARSLRFWSTYSNPATGSVSLSIDGNPIATSELAAGPQVVTFVLGQALVSAKYKDVGEIRISIKDDTVVEPVGGVLGASNLFVVAPANFSIASVTRPDTSPNPGSSLPTDPVFVAAGAPFSVTVEVRDAEGSPTPNFGSEAPAESLRLLASTLVAPAGGRNGSADNGAIGNESAFVPSGPPATFVGSSFYWDEVGAIQLQGAVADGDYLGSGDVLGTESGVVGRFVPDHFDVALNAPQFATACGAGSFSYLGQGFDYGAATTPVATTTAMSTLGLPTANYTGAWFRLNAASLGGLAYTSASGTLSAAGPNLPSVVDLGGGIGSLIFDTGPSLSFARTTPVAPFDAEISLSVDVIDADGVVFATNPARFGSPVPGGGIAFSTGKSVRYGRLTFENAHGSELSALPVPLRTEMYDGSSFLAHLSDMCTSLTVADLGAVPTPVSLVSVPTIGNIPLLSGEAGLALSSPGEGNTGVVDLDFDLSLATGAGMPWLLYDWDGDGTDENPSARGTFGVFRGADELIYVRELY